MSTLNRSNLLGDVSSSAQRSAHPHRRGLAHGRQPTHKGRPAHARWRSITCRREAQWSFLAATVSTPCTADCSMPLQCCLTRSHLGAGGANQEEAGPSQAEGAHTFLEEVGPFQERLPWEGEGQPSAAGRLHQLEPGTQTWHPTPAASCLRPCWAYPQTEHSSSSHLPGEGESSLRMHASALDFHVCVTETEAMWESNASTHKFPPFSSGQKNRGRANR